MRIIIELVLFVACIVVIVYCSAAIYPELTHLKLMSIRHEDRLNSMQLRIDRISFCQQSVNSPLTITP